MRVFSSLPVYATFADRLSDNTITWSTDNVMAMAITLLIASTYFTDYNFIQQKLSFCFAVPFNTHVKPFTLALDGYVMF